jgi:aspartate/methionine/tyrosine aminotransferase
MTDPLEYFKLRPIKAAKVSEISETTATAPVPDNERVNFHIGHPVQDQRLHKLYYQLLTGLDYCPDEMGGDEYERTLNEAGWPEGSTPQLQLLYRAIVQSTPYTPRGGFSRNNPGKLIEYFKDWLTAKQQDPLTYDFGETSGRKECILANGGKWEILRIFFQTFSKYLIYRPANIFLAGLDLPDYLLKIPDLSFCFLAKEEEKILRTLDEGLKNSADKPSFLCLGKLTSEAMRRKLRQWSLTRPLFFIEMNNAPNHLSLGREAKMLNRVLRVINPTVFSNIAISFVLGNTDFIKVLETIQFELKGTPAAAEVELLSFLLDTGHSTHSHDSEFELPPSGKDISNLPAVNNVLAKIQLFSEGLAHVVENKFTVFDTYTKAVSRLFNTSSPKIRTQLWPSVQTADSFAGMHSSQVMELFYKNLTDIAWQQELTNSLLSAFLMHHPEYDSDRCCVVSGSARTAMSLLGFHCDIQEVIAPDLSWTYEHCFPQVEIVPLLEDLALDDEGIINTVSRKLETNAKWPGAVVFNNPHNASGQIFKEEKISDLLHWLLKRGVRVIDDLSYQNVTPNKNLSGPLSIRQVASKLHRNGYITQIHLKNLITVHSLSKTDCFAGARLAIVEILDSDLHEIFNNIVEKFQPNIMAILLAYLFYRNHPEDIQVFWDFRNRVLAERMDALEQALKDLPLERNPYDIDIYRPQGSMYPQMRIDKLPNGVSLDWLASGLAKRGIGLLPLTTFSRTSSGYELARKTFRLTLGGADGAEALFQKTRRVLIDLNRMIAEESALYNTKDFKNIYVKRQTSEHFQDKDSAWKNHIDYIAEKCAHLIHGKSKLIIETADSGQNIDRFLKKFLPDRLDILNQHYQDFKHLALQILEIVRDDRQRKLIDVLENELYKENLTERCINFRHRLYDRTVHPTQMYSLQVDSFSQKLISDIFYSKAQGFKLSDKIASALIEEFLCLNVPITSTQEGDELVYDIQSVILAEEYTRWEADVPLISLLSFWGDWDGSTRPSGQGHRLVAAVLLENVNQQADILRTLLKIDPQVQIEPVLINQIQQLPANNEKFWKLMNTITFLTNQLEKRYQRFMPIDIQMHRLKRLGMRIRLLKDPMTALWQHNDKLERKMLELRRNRRKSLEYYYSLNKQLRKALYGLLPRISENFKNQEMALRAGLFRSLLMRFNLTPRIHQNMIISEDQFAIDTTVHNLVEINEISGKYGNPGMVLALQISMSKQPEALIALDRKLRSHREQVLREDAEVPLPSIWLVPLFEDIETLQNLEAYLDKVWEYAIQSRRIDQNPNDRFAEMVCELFVAGSDLSQQVSQTRGAAIYKETKLRAIKWLADRGLVERVRIKLGSGEPMQRQGGYYKSMEQLPVFIHNKNTRNRMRNHLKASTQKGTEYAKSPLKGVISSGDFRTFQSTISERLRLVAAKERAKFLYHVQESQKYYETGLARVCESLLETRLQSQTREVHELERLTYGSKDQLFEQFISIVTTQFRNILYGTEEDVLGIHIISYFISRAMPVLRDRPTVRPSREMSQSRGQEVIQRIAQTLPLARHGSLLRAIGHNRAQTMILGINQLTTGLFRALSQFVHEQPSYEDGFINISDRILPNLPVYDILHTLRIYHDPQLPHLSAFIRAFPAGNSALTALREDLDSIPKFIGLIQKEYLRRHGLDISDFFEGDRFIPDLLPTLRPDIAVLLQSDLFNTDIEQLQTEIGNKIDHTWLHETQELLKIPDEVKYWRRVIWKLLQESIYQQVQSFVELALAINSISSGQKQMELPFNIEPVKVLRLGSHITDLLRGVSDDSMRQFLVSVVQYLTQLPKTMTEIPIDIIRALRDVERIVKIEEQVLTKKEQDLLRFYILQMARLCGENG